MTPSKNRFIIVCPARSGSTMLVHLVRSHPATVSNGEVMAMTDSLGGFDVSVRADLPSFGDEESLVKWRRKKPVDFMETVAFHGSGADLAGFKIKSDELVRRRYKPILTALRQDTSIKVLHLNRENLLERYVSWVMATKVTGVTLATSDDQVPEFEAVALNPRDCEDDFSTAAKRRALVDEWFADHDVLELGYEQLVLDPESESLRICDFLGIEPRVLQTRTLKLAPHVHSLISNFDELADHFADTEWQHLFEVEPAEAVPRIEASRPTIRGGTNPTVGSITDGGDTHAGPADQPLEQESTRPPAPTPFTIPQTVLGGIAKRWGAGGSPFEDYVASLADLPDLIGTRILDVGGNPEIIEAIASGRCAVGSYVGLIPSAPLVDYCKHSLDDPRIAVHEVDVDLTDDPAEICPDMSPYNLAIVRPRPDTLTETHLDALLGWLRDNAADHARLVLTVPLLERSSAGTTLVDQLLGDGETVPELPEGTTRIDTGEFSLHLYTRAHLRGILGQNGWRLEEVREPRRSWTHHVACTAEG